MGFISRIFSRAHSTPIYALASPYTEISGTYAIGNFKATYAQMSKAFGPAPIMNDEEGSKTSMEWIFKGTDGSVYTIYDYKQTNLYEPDLPSPEALRRSKKPIIWSVGGNEDRFDVRPFIEWFDAQLEASKHRSRGEQMKAILPANRTLASRRVSKPTKRTTRARKGR